MKTESHQTTLWENSTGRATEKPTERADPALVDEIILAIDFGVNGGFCWNEDGRMFSVPMPHGTNNISDKIKEICPSRVFGENIHTMGREGRKSLETFIRGIGRIEGILTCLGIPLCLVDSQRWIRWYGFSSSNSPTQTKWKDFLVAAAQEFYPSQYPTKYTADAILIWNWAANHLDETRPLPPLKL